MSASRDIFAQLAASLNPRDISWRIDSKPKARDGRYFARFVCYVEAGTVRERLDEVIPGEWDLRLEPLSSFVTHDGSETVMAFKAHLQVLGVVREDVGQGPDYKQAATDAFKRAAVRFGIGHELYAMEQNWVEMDGDGKFAKPVEDPQAAYDRRYGSGKQNQNPTNSTSRNGAPSPSTTPTTSPNASRSETTTDEAVSCPKCGGNMFDNRLTKRNPKAPDYKCRRRSCDGVIWPVRAGTGMDQESWTPQEEPQFTEDDLPF